MELIEELGSTDMSSAAWLVTFKKLAHENEHHVKEEDEVFPIVKKSLDDATIEKIKIAKRLCRSAMGSAIAQ